MVVSGLAPRQRLGTGFLAVVLPGAGQIGDRWGSCIWPTRRPLKAVSASMVGIVRRRLGSIFAALLIALAGLMFGGGRAEAAGESWRIPEYHSEVELSSGGTASVRTSFDFDFGDDPGHGPILTFPLRQAIATDPDHWRVIEVEMGSVSSPTGADVTVHTEAEDGVLAVRIGQEWSSFTGVQSYVVNYTVRGVIAPRQAQSGLDEFNWNAIGLGWEVPIDAASVTVHGPAAIERVACYQGSDYSVRCKAASNQRSAEFSAQGVGDSSGMQVVAGFPAGTFFGAEAKLERRPHLGNSFELTPWTGGIAALLSALGVGSVAWLTRRAKRDEAYQGVTPGAIPPNPDDAAVGQVDPSVPVAVQFTPPAGARPGEIGTLIDASADHSDLAATFLDLAVRGHLSISQNEAQGWTFQRQSSADALVGFEEQALASLFRRGATVTTQDLRDPGYSHLMPDLSAGLYTRVSKELKWYRSDPAVTRKVALMVGGGVLFLSGFVTLWLTEFGWGLVGLGGVVIGLAILVANKRFSSRTALGSAMLAQARGFELYLRTAEADQIRFEEGIDVFSKYLPYAVVFGVAERWTKIFSELAASGRYEFQTDTWYHGFGSGLGYGFLYGDFASSMSHLSESMTASVQAATAATSGGSGFSGGGGGFGGGGGGGW